MVAGHAARGAAAARVVLALAHGADIRRITVQPPEHLALYRGEPPLLYVRRSTAKLCAWMPIDHGMYMVHF